MKVASTCADGALTVELEAGHFMLTGSPAANAGICDAIRSIVSTYRDEYELRFGHQRLTRSPVRIRATEDLRATGIQASYVVTGHTYDDAVDLAQSAWESLPHELNPVRTGPGHAGWCADYEPWSEEVLGIDQRSYLGCR
jgi:hypothetical protein